jgi:hypothetical protein
MSIAFNEIFFTDLINTYFRLFGKTFIMHVCVTVARSRNDNVAQIPYIPLDLTCLRQRNVMLIVNEKH